MSLNVSFLSHSTATPIGAKTIIFWALVLRSKLKRLNISKPTKKQLKALLTMDPKDETEYMPLLDALGVKISKDRAVILTTYFHEYGITPRPSNLGGI